MIQRRYHIRAGAKTAAGGTVRASNSWYTLDGVPLACDGDPVDCPACGTEGVIRCVAPRIPDHFNGREFALSEDLCICKCSPAPRLIADQTVKYQVLLMEDARDLARQAPSAAADPIYDERPRLVAPPIEGLPYHIETGDGRRFSGRTGRDGLLPRIVTEGEGEYHVYWGDEALARMIGEKEHG